MPTMAPPAIRPDRHQEHGRKSRNSRARPSLSATASGRPLAVQWLAAPRHAPGRPGRLDPRADLPHETPSRATWHRHCLMPRTVRSRCKTHERRVDSSRAAGRGRGRDLRPGGPHGRREARTGGRLGRRHTRGPTAPSTSSSTAPSCRVEVRDARPVDVLQALGVRGGVPVTVQGELPGRITRAFTAASVEDAVREVLRGYSMALVFGRASEDTAPARAGSGSSPSGTLRRRQSPPRERPRSPRPSGVPPGSTRSAPSPEREVSARSRISAGSWSRTATPSSGPGPPSRWAGSGRFARRAP